MILGLMVCSLRGLAQTRSDYADYINRYAPLALQEEARTGIPAAIKMAQALLESGAGKGSLALRSNNHFGIKCKSNWTGPTFLHDDDARNECFRGYGTVEESFADHSNYLRTSARYQKLFALNINDIEGWAYGLKAAGYATNPKYPQLLLRVIRDNRLDSLAFFASTGISAKQTSTAPVAVSKIAMVENVVSTKEPVEVADTRSNTSVVKPVKIDYPTGVFRINGLKVVYAMAGTSMLSIAQRYGNTVAQLNSFNDMNEYAVLAQDQLIFLERKKLQGEAPTYTATGGESLWQVSQVSGVRLYVLQAANPSFRGVAQAGHVFQLTEPNRKSSIASLLSH